MLAGGCQAVFAPFEIVAAAIRPAGRVSRQSGGQDRRIVQVCPIPSPAASDSSGRATLQPLESRPRTRLNKLTPGRCIDGPASSPMPPGTVPPWNRGQRASKMLHGMSLPRALPSVGPQGRIVASIRRDAIHSAVDVAVSKSSIRAGGSGYQANHSSDVMSAGRAETQTASEGERSQRRPVVSQDQRPSHRGICGPPCIPCAPRSILVG